MLFARFGVSFLMHLLNPWQDLNGHELTQGKHAETLNQLPHEPEFWFASFQNW